MPANESNVLSSSDEDEDDNVLLGEVNNPPVRLRSIAAVVPSRASCVKTELKAPLHVDHLLWCCAVSGGGTDECLVPVYNALIDHGAYAVLI